MSGRPAYEVNPEATEQFYQSNIYDPAVREYENVTRPGFLESLGSLHSSSRANLERTSRQDLANNLSQQRGNLFYQDEQARRQAAAMGKQLQAGALGQGLAYQQAQLAQSQIPIQNLLAALGVSGVENIVTQPSVVGGIIGNIPGVGSSFF
jgi:hypothetical protein